ncbi:MAG: hypothetical protein JEY97_10725 [Bacteroidales bacterium]|nr:hypothetical protein [Bacteroidales bacterium]
MIFKGDTNDIRGESIDVERFAIAIDENASDLQMGKFRETKLLVIIY